MQSTSPTKDSMLSQHTPSASQSQVLAAQWINPRRVRGLRRAVAIAVGEKHSVALQGFWIPKLPECLELHVLARKVPSGAEARVSAGEVDGDDAMPSGYEGARPSDDGSESLSTLARPPRHHRDWPGYDKPHPHSEVVLQLHA